MRKGSIKASSFTVLKAGVFVLVVASLSTLIMLHTKNKGPELTGQLTYDLNSWEKEQFRANYGCDSVTCDSQKDYESYEIGSSLTRDELACCSDLHFSCMHSQGGFTDRAWRTQNPQGYYSCGRIQDLCSSAEAIEIFPYLSSESNFVCMDGEGCPEVLNPEYMYPEVVHMWYDKPSERKTWPRVCGIYSRQPHPSTKLTYAVDMTGNRAKRKAPSDCTSSYDCDYDHVDDMGGTPRGECVNGKCVEPDGLRCGEASFSCGQQATCENGAQTGVLEWCDDTFIDQYFYTDICWRQEVDCDECDTICASGTATEQQQQICGCENQAEEPTPVCGNGEQEDGEQCDDGNTTNGDGCSASCVIEECGDGIVQAGLDEQCDDGNTTNGDGCSAACETEEPAPVCGNGEQEDGEQCDDGNTANGDGCSAACETEESSDPCAPIALNPFQKFLAFVGVEVAQEIPPTCFQCCTSATSCVEMAGSVENNGNDCRILNNGGWAKNNGSCPQNPAAIEDLCNPCGNARLDDGEECDLTSASNLHCTAECTCASGYIYNADTRKCVKDLKCENTVEGFSGTNQSQQCANAEQTWCNVCDPSSNPICCPKNYACAPYGSDEVYRCKRLVECLPSSGDNEADGSSTSVDDVDGSKYFCDGTEQCMAAYDANGVYDPEGTGVRCIDNRCCGGACGACPGGNSTDGGPNESPLSPPDDNNAGPNQPNPPTGPAPNNPPGGDTGDTGDSGPRILSSSSVASSVSSQSVVPAAPQCEAGVCQDRQACFDAGGRCFDVGFSCAEGDITFETCCCIPFDTENPQHLICEDNQCVLTDGEGDDECAGDNDCVGDTHLECRNQQCAAVPGAGKNTCISDDDCRDDVHFGCLGSQCTLLPGARSNTCNGDNDCTGGGGGRLECVGNQCVITMSSGISTCASAEDCTGDMHLGCENEQCTILPGVGADTCSTNDDCTDQVHLACQNEACVFVPGAGANECDTALDCGVEQHTECQDNQCVVVDGPGGNECNTNIQCGKHTECQDSQCVVVDGPGQNTCLTSADCVASCPVGQECIAADACIHGGGEVGLECGPSGDTVCCTTTSSSQSSLATSAAISSAPLPPSSSSSFQSVLTSSAVVVSSVASSVSSSVATSSEVTFSSVAVSSSDASVFSATTSSSSSTTLSSSRSTQIALQSDSSSSVGHLRCVRNSCVFVPQDGVSTCSTDADCLDEDDDQIRLIMGDTTCGNGLLEDYEECDDGNMTNNDGCSARCTLEQSEPGTPTLVAAATICGNGLLEDGEECDDGNRRDDDGCTARCLLSVGLCGDGIVQTLLGEQCEASRHDTSLPYLCSNCRFASQTCGDGTVDAGEECDNGTENSNEPDASCRQDCSVARCGDGITDSVEQCDDGNRVDNDGCDQYCLQENPDQSYPATQVAAEAGQFWQFPTSSQQPSQWLSTVQFPNQPNMQNIPYQLPLAQLQPLVQGQAPVGDTGPAAVAVIGAGAAAGWGWMRRRKR